VFGMPESQRRRLRIEHQENALLANLPWEASDDSVRRKPGETVLRIMRSGMAKGWVRRRRYAIDSIPYCQNAPYPASESNRR
jgi:hypothetical protein